MLFVDTLSGYHSIFSTQPKSKMRATLPATLLLATLLAACASSSDQQINKHISQGGPLKVHPGLVNQPVPTEQQPAPQPAAKPADPATPAAAAQ